MKFKSWIGNHKILVGLFLVALIFRLFFFGVLLTQYGPGSFYLDNDGQSLSDTTPHHDAQHYVVIAKNLVEHQKFSHFVEPPLESTSLRTPLYAFYFVPFIYFFGFGSIWLAILVLIIIVSLTPVVAYRLARLFLSKKLSIILGLVVALEPLLAYRASIAEADALLVFVFLLVLYYFISFFKKGNSKQLYFSAVLFGIATLIKPVGIFLWPLFIILIFCRLLFFKDGFKKTLIKSIYFLAIFFVILFPWMLRNQLTFNVFDISSIKGFNLYIFYTKDIPLENEQVNFSPNDRVPEKSIKYQKQLTDISIARIKAKPLIYARSHLMGTVRSLFVSDLQTPYYYGHEKVLPFPYDPVNKLNVSQSIVSGNWQEISVFLTTKTGYLIRLISFSLFYVLVLLGWIKSFKRDKKTFVVFTFFMIMAFYFVFTPGPFVDTKYRLPAIPLWLIVFFYLFKSNNQLSSEKVNFKKGKLVSGVIYPKFFPINRESTVLNIGCGDGVQALIYGGNFKKMVGVDINENRLKTARQLTEDHNIKNFETIKSNVEAIPISEEFDQIIAIDIIEHVIHPNLVANEIYRLLKNDGEALVTFPAMHDKWENLFKFIGRKILRRKSKTVIQAGWDPDQHQYDYSPKQWIELVEKSGLKFVNSRASTMFPPLHYLGVPRFWFKIKIIRSIDGLFCRIPRLKNLGQSVVCRFKKVK
jgi:4-amino-4-deoxy-L-arabinose transferase-like glycosyltransferase/ubiquinone/menaquinone biosynthesis C-methylase UbiE